MTRIAVMVATVFALLGFAHNVRAQELKLGGLEIGLGTGIERSDLLQDGSSSAPEPAWSPALDGRVDEARSEGMAIIGFAELEPHGSLGAEIRYLQWLSRKVTVFAGGIGVIAPHTLAGVEVGAQVHIPLNKETMSLFMEPSFAAIPLGTDLPGDAVLLWGLLTVGVRAAL